jgi:nitrite reductase/ring-hydroxylating ferredoxin subunit
MTFKQVSKLSDIPAGTMKHIDIDGLEVLLANIGDEIYAIENRCGHMGARLSKGTLTDNLVECSLHHAQFDVRTGKLVREPKTGKLVSMKPTGNLSSMIKTYDRKTYNVKVGDGIIKINV